MLAEEKERQEKRQERREGGEEGRKEEGCEGGGGEVEVVGGGATGRRYQVEVPRAQGTRVRAALRAATGPRGILLWRETSKYARGRFCTFWRWL